MEGNGPLAQRTAASRKLRRSTRADNKSNKSPTSQNKFSEGADMPAAEQFQNNSKQRGPSAEIERRIAASIEKRTRANAAAVIVEAQNDDRDGLPEILGTYEYLDHTADIQLHSWGESLENALEQLAISMFGYMTKLSLIEENERDSSQHGSIIQARGHDVTSLVFSFLQEWLYKFHETGFVPRNVCVRSLDLQTYSVVSSGRGETLKKEKHTQGTEVKAVTYSNLQVIKDDSKSRFDIWVILDI